MCGITGFVGFRDPELIYRMTDLMHYRGPDGSGYHIGENVSMGMRRLAIIDVVGGSQPIYNEDSTMCIVFNGEVYNYQEWRKPLEERGHFFKTSSDTETILHLYEEFGHNCPSKLRGMFAFAIWDKRRQELFIARDRMGIKPLYYILKDGILYFASEIKSLLEVPTISENVEVDYSALHAYLTLQYVPQPLTLFKHIYKLPPGHTLSFKSGGNLMIKPYWNLAEYATEHGLQSEEEALEYLETLIKESVKLRMISEVPLGAFLSGGIDSSLIVGMMAELSSRPVKTFTVGFDSDKPVKLKSRYDETDHARFVSRYFGCEYHEIVLKPTMVDLLPRLIWHMDEPIADRAALPTYLISEFARQSVTVAITGEGGDELFGGYPRYILEKAAQKYHSLPHLFSKLGSNIGNRLNLPVPGMRYARKVLTSPADPVARHLEWIGNFSQGDLQAGNLYKPDFAAQLVRDCNTKFVTNTTSSYLKEGARFGTVGQSAYLDLNTWLVDDILMKVDKVSMAASVEARVPLLDHKLAEYAIGLPDNLKVRGLTTKYALRKILAKKLPDKIVNRPKHAFDIPAAQWFRRDLKELVRSVLLDETAQKRPYFNFDFVRQLTDEHFSGRRDHNQKIWNLLCLELWHRIYIDKTLVI